jgi:hypothetical protein
MLTTLKTRKNFIFKGLLVYDMMTEEYKIFYLFLSPFIIASSYYKSNIKVSHS